MTRFFRKRNDEDYETVLSSLALDIQKRQVKLSEIRLRERRSTLLVTLYTLAGWVGYVSLWYLGLLPNISGHAKSRFERAVKGAPVVIGPIVILFVRRIVQIWYTRKGDAEEKMLQKLMKQQRSKVEEIKKKTNYYSTRDLLQRYDDSASSPSTLRQRLFAPSTQPSTPQQQPRPPIAKGTLQTPNLGTAQITSAPPTGPPRKLWYDKLADALLGDDDHTPSAAASRYALICEKCFAHNGLVKESMWEDAQYVCPKCNHFNASMRSRKSARGPSPLSPNSPKSVSAISSPNPTSEQQSPPGPNGSPQDTDSKEMARAPDTAMMEVDDS